MTTRWLSHGWRVGAAAVTAGATALAFSAVASAAPVPNHGDENGGTETTIEMPDMLFTELSGGYTHGTALGDNGRLYSWGDDGSDRLGLGESFSGSTTVPNQVVTPGGVSLTEVSAAESHNLALGADGHVYAWGANGHGQLGNGATKANADDSPTAIQVNNVSNAMAVTAAGSYAPVSFAVTSSGDVYSWGSNKYGLLGQGKPSENATDSFHSTPAKIAGLSNITQVTAAAGDYPYALALDSSGDVWGWGRTDRGVLGVPKDNISDRTTPTKTITGKNFVDISAGASRFVVALDSSGDVWTWGNIGPWIGHAIDGSLSGNDPVPPAKVSGLPTITQVDANGSLVVALDDNGQAWTWGSNKYGGLGHPGSATGSGSSEAAPVKVAMPSGVKFTNVSAGWDFVLATGDDGHLYGWGCNDDGQLATGSTVEVQATPVRADLSGLHSNGKLTITGAAFDGTPGTNLARTTNRSYTVDVPAHAAAKVDVTVSYKANGKTQPDLVFHGFEYDCYPFTDVGKGSIFCKDVSWLKQQGITSGYPDGSFHPQQVTSRRAMAKYLYQMEHPGSTSAPTCTSKPFPDVDTGSIFCGYIDWFQSAGITSGYPDGNFHGKRDVGRQAMAKFLYAYQHPNATSAPTCTSKPFPDVDTGSIFCGYIDWFQSAGITSGYPDGNFHGKRPVGRQAMAKFLHNL